MTRIKFTFAATMAMLVAGLLIGFSLNEIGAMASQVKIEIPPPIAAALRAAVIAMAIVIAGFVAMRGMIVPPNKGL